MRRRSRRWRACVRAVRAVGRGDGVRVRSRGLPRAWLRARTGGWMPMGDAGYAPRGRAQRADDARALLLGGGREALISGSVRHFGNVSVVFCGPLILRCVASPYDGPTGNLSPGRRRRARSMFDGAARRARGGVPSLLGGAAPLPRARRAIPGGRAGRPPVRTLVSSRLRHPRTTCNDDKLAPVRH